MTMTKPMSSRFAAWGMKPVLVYVAMALFAGGLGAIDWGECFIQSAGSVRLAGAWSCPNVTPTLTVSTYYRCDECGESGPREPISATGEGQCCNENTCTAILDWVDYGIASMEIQIRNRRTRLCSLGCRNNGYSIATAHCNCPLCGPPTPIIISLVNNSLHLTGPEDGVEFDLTADGTPEHTAWTKENSDEAFLALDRNGNGFIDNGGELFGDHTAQPSSDPADRNGFEALAVFDDSLSGGNEDGIIDENDEIFSDLRMWRDSNHNGISEANEILSMSDARVVAIDLAYRTVSRTDGHGNGFRFASGVEMSQGRRTAWDVFLQQL